VDLGWGSRTASSIADQARQGDRDVRTGLEYWYRNIFRLRSGVEEDLDFGAGVRYKHVERTLHRSTRFFAANADGFPTTRISTYATGLGFLLL